MKLEELTKELNKLNVKMRDILTRAHFDGNCDLSSIEDFQEVRSADDLQRLEEYKRILCVFDIGSETLQLLNTRVIYESRLHLNPDERYEDEKGVVYTSGYGIEFLRDDVIYRDGKEINVQIWTRSRVESKNGQYFIVGHEDIDMDGLLTRVRA